MADLRTAVSAALAIVFYIAGAATALAQDGYGGHRGSHTVPVGAGRDLSGQSRAFLQENAAAMTKMMSSMELAPSGDIDRDFVEMMIPHHQGAIDMAKAVLRYSRNEQIRRLAQEIIVTQQQEIAAMRLALGDPLPAPDASPTQIAPAQ